MLMCAYTIIHVRYTAGGMLLELMGGVADHALARAAEAEEATRLQAPRAPRCACVLTRALTRGTSRCGEGTGTGTRGRRSGR